jgi:hypothetical protein
MGDENSHRDEEDAPGTPTERKDPTSPIMRRWKSLPEATMRKPEKGQDDVVGKSVAKATPSQRPGAPPPNLDPMSGRPPPRNRKKRDSDSEMLGAGSASKKPEADRPFVPRDATPDPKRETAREMRREDVGDDPEARASGRAAARTSFPPEEPATTRVDLFLGIGAAVLVLAVVAGVWLGVQTGAPEDAESEADTTTTARGLETREETGRENERAREGAEEGALAEEVAEEGALVEGAEEGSLVEDAEAVTAEGATDVAGAGAAEAGLAALPTPREEVRLMNPWVRRNRAGELRLEARRLNAVGQDAQAEATWRESLEYFPDSAEAQLSLARTIARLGRVEEGLAWARRAAATNPMDPRAHEHVGDLLLQQERRAEALEAYRAGLAVAPMDIRLRSRVRRIDER